MSGIHLDPRQAITSLVLFVLGAFAVYTGAADYGLGEWFHLGAGAFPFLLGLLLIALSAINLLAAFDAPPAPTRHQWLGALAFFAAIAVFAVSIDTLGLVPAVFALTLIARLAEPPFEAVDTLLLAAGLSLLAYLIFIFGLGMPLEAFNWF